MALAKTPEFLRSFEFKNLLKDNWKPADKLVMNDPNTNTKKDENFSYNWELPSNYLEKRGYINFLSKREENTTIKQPNPIKEKKPFLEKIKDAWIRFVNKNKNKTISVNHTEATLSPSQSFLNFLYDDESWLNENGENLIETSTEVPHENQTRKNDQKIFQNLTESDVDFLKKIINCFKKNKEIETEMINEVNRKTGNGKANKTDENVIFPKTTTERPHIINVTTTTTTTTTKPPIYENCSQSKFNFTLNNTIEGILHQIIDLPLFFFILFLETKIDPNQEEFISTGDYFNKSEDSGNQNELKIKYFENKVKFLAHSHHSVYEVGKSSNGHIDLERIQELIDDAKRSLNLRNLSGNCFLSMNSSWITFLRRHISGAPLLE